MSFSSANTPDGFGEHRDKKYPMCTIKYTVFDVVGLYFCWRSWTSCLDTWHHGFYQILTDKNQKVTDSVRNLIMGHVWIFQPDNNPNTNLKNNTKMGHWAQNQASALAIPVLWPEPCRRWVRWTEEKKHCHRAVNLKGLKWFWMKEWSLMSCQVFSNLIRHYRRKLKYFGKWRFQKVLNKRVPLIVANVYRRKNIYFIMISPPPPIFYSYPMKG